MGSIGAKSERWQERRERRERRHRRERGLVTPPSQSPIGFPYLFLTVCCSLLLALLSDPKSIAQCRASELKLRIESIGRRYRQFCVAGIDAFLGDPNSCPRFCMP
jgi:hypothetical protein